TAPFPCLASFDHDEHETADKICQLGKAPSFGYSSLKEEIDHSLASRGGASSSSHLQIVHSYDKSSEESAKLLVMYEKAQDRVEKALASGDFLGDVLKK